MIRIIALLLVLAGPVWATPPRMTTSEDRIVAATQTHLYVLRDIMDNLGSHYAALHDQHLIEISLDSGEATRFWPLRHVAANHLATDDFQVPGEVSERPGETHDMIGVLRGLGAEPMIPHRWAVEGLTLETGALMKGDEQLVTPFGIRAAGRAQLAILRAYYPPIESEEAYLRADQIDFYDLYAEGDWECTLVPEGQPLFRGRMRLIVARLHCEDAELSGAWSFHLMIEEEL